MVILAQACTRTRPKTQKVPNRTVALLLPPSNYRNNKHHSVLEMSQDRSQSSTQSPLTCRPTGIQNSEGLPARSSLGRPRTQQVVVKEMTIQQ